MVAWSAIRLNTGRMKSALTSLCLALLTTVLVAAEKLNVLFIAVDDLRPELGCYGRAAKSPNIDRLAAEAMLFERAYVQVALCMPSRVSMLTGRRPDTTGVVDFSVRFRDILPDVVTLPQHFKNHGYRAVAFGKIFHNDDKASWSEPLFKSQRTEDDYHTEFGKNVLKWIKEDHRRLTYVWDLGDGVTKTKRPGGLPWEAPDIPDNAVRDGQLADAAIAKLGKLKDEPFSLRSDFTNRICHSSRPENTSTFTTVRPSRQRQIRFHPRTPRNTRPIIGTTCDTTTASRTSVRFRPNRRGT